MSIALASAIIFISTACGDETAKEQNTVTMQDAMGNYAYSDQVTFDRANGEIITTVY